MRKIAKTNLIACILSIWPIAGLQADTCPPPVGIAATNPLICQYAVRLRCPSQQRTASGFVTTIDGAYGVVTALHAVVDCTPGEIEMTGAMGTHRLRLTRANIARDAALLSGLGRRGPSLTVASGIPVDKELYVIGYPFGIYSQRGIWLGLTHPINGALGGTMITDHLETLRQRNSPSLDTRVLFFDGELNRGHSGAPIVNAQGYVVAFGDGGFKQDNSDFVWAIPLEGLKWTDPADLARSRLRGTRSSALASFGADRPPPSIPALYLADNYDPDGIIYRRFPNAMASVAFRGHKQPFSAFATHPPSGRMVIVRGNAILSFRNGKLTTLYEHDERIAGIAFNPIGEIYFSTVDQHNTRTGIIWRLRKPRAQAHLRINLRDMRNHWLGDFAIAPDGAIWLSNGNLSTASLYKLVNMRPKHRYTPPARPIGGFVFASKDLLLYTDLNQTVHSLYLPTMTEGEEFRFESGRRLSDVALIPGAATNPKGVVVGYLVVWDGSGIDTPEDITPGMKICGTGDDIGRLRLADPRLAAANLIEAPPSDWYQMLQTAGCQGFVVDDFALLSRILGPQASAFRRIEISAH